MKNLHLLLLLAFCAPALNAAADEELRVVTEETLAAQAAEQPSWGATLTGWWQGATGRGEQAAATLKKLQEQGTAAFKTAREYLAPAGQKIGEAASALAGAFQSGQEAAAMLGKQAYWLNESRKFKGYLSHPNGRLLVQGSAYQSIADSMLQDIYLSLRAFDALPSNTRNQFKSLADLLLSSATLTEQVYTLGINKHVELAQALTAAASSTIVQQADISSLTGYIGKYLYGNSKAYASIASQMQALNNDFAHNLYEGAVEQFIGIQIAAYLANALDLFNTLDKDMVVRLSLDRNLQPQLNEAADLVQQIIKQGIDKQNAQQKILQAQQEALQAQQKQLEDVTKERDEYADRLGMLLQQAAQHKMSQPAQQQGAPTHARGTGAQGRGLGGPMYTVEEPEEESAAAASSSTQGLLGNTPIIEDYESEPGSSE